MENLNLQNFTSILEILFVYNIGIAFSREFRNFLGMNRRINNLIQKHDEFIGLSRLHVRKAHYEKLFNEKQREYLNNNFQTLRNKMEVLFYENGLEKFLRPFYIYFGILTMAYLFFAGTLGIAFDYMHLMFLNIISSLIALCCLWNSFRIRKVRWKSGEMRIFFGSLALIALSLLTPQSLLNYASVPYSKFNLFGYIELNGFQNLQIIGAVLLAFTPVIIEMLQIFICLRQLRKIRTDHNSFAAVVLPVLVEDMNYLGQTFDQNTIEFIQDISNNSINK